MAKFDPIDIKFTSMKNIFNITYTAHFSDCGVYQEKYKYSERGMLNCSVWWVFLCVCVNGFSKILQILPSYTALFVPVFMTLLRLQAHRTVRIWSSKLLFAALNVHEPTKHFALLILWKDLLTERGRHWTWRTDVVTTERFRKPFACWFPTGRVALVRRRVCIWFLRTIYLCLCCHLWLDMHLTSNSQ